MGETKEGVIEWLEKRGASFYILVILVVFPVFYRNGLFNLSADKKSIFLFSTCLYICVVFPAFIQSICNWKKENLRLIKVDTIFAIILLMSLIISTILALDSHKSFFEMTVRTVSGSVFFGCIIVFFSVRKYGEYDGVFLWGWLIGSSLIYVLGIFAACGLDFMHMQEGILENEKPFFLTPLGQMDMNTCYVCITLPLIIVMYMICKERFSQVLHGINLYMGFMFIYFIKTDSVIIAIIVGVVALVYFAVETERWFERYLQVIGIYLCSKITIWLLLNMFENQIYPFNDLGGELLKGNWLFGDAVIYLLIIGICKIKKDCLRKQLLLIRRIVLHIGIALSVCFVICVIFANVNKTGVKEDSFWNYLVIKDSTFNGRGFIWRTTLEALDKEPIGRIFYGNGLNCYKDFIIEGGIIPAEKIIYTDPHNELLQMLVDMGILGIIGYFGLLLSTLIKALKSWKKNELQIVVALTLCVYLVQGLVNEYSIFHLPLLFIFLGLANGSMTKNESNAVENT